MLGHKHIRTVDNRRYRWDADMFAAGRVSRSPRRDRLPGPPGLLRGRSAGPGSSGTHACQPQPAEKRGTQMYVCPAQQLVQPPDLHTHPATMRALQAAKSVEVPTSWSSFLVARVTDREGAMRELLKGAAPRDGVEARPVRLTQLGRCVSIICRLNKSRSTAICKTTHSDLGAGQTARLFPGAVVSLASKATS